MASITVDIKIFPDPLFNEFIKLAETDKAFRDGVEFLIEEQKFFVLKYFSLTKWAFHFSDEALQLFYRHKGV